MTPKQPSGDEQPAKTGPVARFLAWLKRVSYGRRIAAGVAAYVAVAIPIVLYAPARLLNNWVPGLTPGEQGKLLGAAGNLVLLALGGVIAVVTVGLSLSRHRQELDAAERDRQRLFDDQERERARLSEVADQRRVETERSLRERFVTTVQLLSDTAPVNRQAALYALGALADDWDALDKRDEVQVCIEVLTGYLRAPRTKEMLSPLDPEEAQYTDPEDYYVTQRTTPVEVSVKQAGYAVIRNHLQQGASPSWHNHQLNLSRAHIDFPVELPRPLITADGALDLRGIWIGHNGSADLAAAQISGAGRLHLTEAVIVGNGSIDLRAAVVSERGTVDLRDVSISHGQVHLMNAKVTGLGSVVLRGMRIRNRGIANLQDLSIGDGGNVDLTSASIDQDGQVLLHKLAISNDGNVDLADAAIGGGGIIDLSRAVVRDRGRIDFARTAIGATGRVDLSGAVISDGATVDLDAPKITRGGRVIRPDGMSSMKAT